MTPPEPPLEPLPENTVMNFSFLASNASPAQTRFSGGSAFVNVPDVGQKQVPQFFLYTDVTLNMQDDNTGTFLLTGKITPGDIIPVYVAKGSSGYAAHFSELSNITIRNATRGTEVVLNAELSGGSDNRSNALFDVKKIFDNMEIGGNDELEYVLLLYFQDWNPPEVPSGLQFTPYSASKISK